MTSTCRQERPADSANSLDWESGSRVGPIRYASDIDAFAYGEHRIVTPPAAPRPVRQFTDRLSADGSSGFRAEPGRYHLYGGWSCPRSHQAAIVLALHRLTHVVSTSYVDRLRDGRGWAFRQRTGADPVNGFTLLREAYEASAPGYDGNISIPVLWDRRRNRIVSNNPATIDVELATSFAAWDNSGIDSYPMAHRDHIDAASREITKLDRGIVSAVYYDVAKVELRVRLRDLDRQLAKRRYLISDSVTLADIRLWVVLVRYEAGSNANGAAGPKLSSFGHLWDYARDLYALPSFRATTDFDAFTAPLTPLADWSRPVNRRGPLMVGHSTGNS